MPTTRTINGVTKPVYSVDELHQMIDAVICHGRGVTDWEQHLQYSDKQAEVIEKIYAERTA